MAIPLLPIAVGVGFFLLSGKKKSNANVPPKHDLPENPATDFGEVIKDTTAVVSAIGGIIPIVATLVGGGSAGGGGAAAAGTVAAVAPISTSASASASAASATAEAVAAAAGISEAAAGGIVFAVIVIVVVATIIIATTVLGYDAWKGHFRDWDTFSQGAFVQNCLFGERFYAGGVWQYENDKRGLIPEIGKITEQFCSLTVVDAPQLEISNKFLPRLIQFDAR